MFGLGLVKNQKGFQLMDVVASLGLSSLTAVFMQSYMLMQNTEMQKTQRVATRETLVELIKLNVNSINIKRMAASQFNKGLEDCILKGKLCKSLEMHPLVLFSLTSNINNPFEAIGGTEQSPQLYDASGLACASGSKDSRCIYEVITSFRIQCKPDLSSTYQPASTCSSTPTANQQGIDLIEIFYKVKPTDFAKTVVMKGQSQEYEGSIIIPYSN